MTTGLYAGSFDPLHCGHVGLIETAAKTLDRLFVVATGNPAKAGSLLSLDQRAHLIALATEHLPNVSAASHTGLVVDLARRLSVDVLVRSMGKEQRAEMQMAAANARLGVPTAFFAPAAATSHISSRMVRERLRTAGVESIRGLVPIPVYQFLRSSMLTV
jgi:pantetheine-phosphate adenylyltransferase